LHIEVQHTKDADFPARMFTYFCRIYDRYKRDVASMAVLVDKNKNWQPNQYYRKILGSEIKRTYEVIKLIDFKPKIAELRSGLNPFTLVVACQLAALETTTDDETRLLTKLELVRRLIKHGWSVEKSMDLYRFLDTILSLPPTLELQYMAAAKQFDKESNMQLMSGIEREGYNRGIHNGVQQGESIILISLLEHKFNTIPENYIQQVK
jgi:hypothetical protein